ncbi:MAG: hypothetical protein HY785_14070 [Oscillatoriophycideae cyanobacterium NC_groundwater_1537_Pr4_S-0.65um_50_18]|nr:hypothetical protein [Oscillatoriophycideae cyanobacterium NC_groundwater_1537_Pr4_S-0.65um_50_18]
MSPTHSPSLQEHIISTYGALRRGIGFLAIALPIILSVGGFVKYGLTPQDSISAYYHAFVPTAQPPGLFEIAGNGVMRNWFVGILWAISVFLILYRGYGRRENTVLNIAGVLLIAVAMFPMDWTCGTTCPKVSVHGVSAILFFLAIGYVCIFRSGDTLELINPSARESYKRWYRIIGLLMWVFPLVVAALEFFKLHPFGTRTVFFIEAAGIWTFAAYWLIKSHEISFSNADVVAIEGDLVRAPRKSGAIQYWLDTTPHSTKE